MLRPGEEGGYDVNFGDPWTLDETNCKEHTAHTAYTASWLPPFEQLQA